MAVISDIISQIRSLNGELSNQEQKVADYILHNLEEAAYLRQSEIAEAAGVSDATVNRFCRSLECDGFRDFKIRLVQSVAVSLQFMDGSPQEDASIDHTASQIFNSITESLNHISAQLDEMALGRAVNALTNAERVVFYGVGGSSAGIARESANRFSCLGIPSQHENDGFTQRMLAATLGAKDVLVIFSASGLPSQLLDSASIARQYSAFTIAVTKSNSSLSQQCDTTIGVDMPESMDIFKPNMFRFAFLAILDILAAGVARKDPDKAKDFMRRARTSLVSLHADFANRPVGD